MIHKNPFRKIPLTQQKKDHLAIIKKKLKKFKLSKCQISKETCLDLFQEYMVTSSVHGLKYPVEKNRSIYERFYPQIVLVANVIL